MNMEVLASLRGTTLRALSMVPALVILCGTPSHSIAAPAVDLGTGAGFPGTSVSIPVTLTKNGSAVAGTSNDIVFDNAAFALSGCTINPPSGQTLAGPQMLCTNGTTCTSDANCTMPNKCNVVRVGTFNFTASVAPDGLLLTCTFNIAPSATPANYVLTNTPGASDASGDGNDRLQVTIDEVLRMVNIALGNASLFQCEAGDANHDGHVTIDEILTAVNNALNGCP